MGIVVEVIFFKLEKIWFWEQEVLTVLPGRSKKTYLNSSCLKCIAVCKPAIWICTSIKKYQSHLPRLFMWEYVTFRWAN